jgi:hypothetical protein
MTIQTTERAPIDDLLRAPLAREVEAAEHEVRRLHADQVGRASEAASWATHSFHRGSAGPAAGQASERRQTRGCAAHAVAHGPAGPEP